MSALDIHFLSQYGKYMLDWAVYLWQFPYVRWHVFFTFLPTLLVWSFFWKYLLQYKKTLIYATVLALMYGIPADLLASPGLHLWVFNTYMHFGQRIAGLPLGEYVFILCTPQLIVSLLLIIRGKMYGKI